MRERNPGIGDLALTRFASQLPHGFDQQKQAVHAGVDAGEAAAIGVDRKASARSDMAARYERSALALPAKAEIL
jgi:hypothetical protein